MPKTVPKTKTKAMTKTIITPISKPRRGGSTKTPLGNKLKSSDWYLNASQSIAIGHGGDFRGGHHWMRRIDREQD